MLFNIKSRFGAVKEAMSVVALIDALLLTVVLTIPLSMSRSDLQAINDLFVNQSFNPSIFFTQKQPYGNLLVLGSGATLQEGFASMSTLLGFMYTTAVCTLASSLVSINITYTFGAVSDIEDDAERFQLWWFFARWIVLGEIVLTITGVFYTFYAFNLLVMMKFAGLTPQAGDCYSVDPSGAMINAPNDATLYGHKLRCPQDYNAFAQITFLAAAAAGSMGLLCLANLPMAAARERRSHLKRGTGQGH